MYDLLIVLHSYLRWVVLGLLIWVAVQGFAGWLGCRPYGRRERLLGAIATGVLDLQLLIGVLLYGLYSPLSRIIFADFSAAMRSASLRFWAVEHLSLGLLAVFAVHLGRILTRRADLENQRHKRTAIAFAIALVLVLLAIPWPFREAARPLLRF